MQMPPDPSSTFEAEAPPQLPDTRVAVVALIVVYWVMFQIIFYIFLTMGASDEQFTLASFVLGVARYMLLPAEVLITLSGGALCYAMYAALRRIHYIGIWWQLPIAGALTLVAAVAFSLVVRLVLTAFDMPPPPLTSRYMIVDTARWIAPFGLWAAITLALAYENAVKDRERRLSQVRARAHEAQVRALRYQVNPHFLYNTLNSISALILDGKTDAADAMVMRLSNFFRASLAVDPLRDVSLADEIALQRLYLDIEQIRFAKTLTVEIDLPPDLEAARVPSLILQPLVENALKHGVNPAGTPTRLTVSAREGDGLLRLLVTDNGPGRSTRQGTGTGLANVRRRLMAQFGSNAGLEVSSAPGGGFSVCLTMPLRFA